MAILPFLDSSAMAESDTLPDLNITNLACRDDFFESNFTCLPHCDRWDGRPPMLAVVEDIIRVTGVLLDMVTNGLFLLIFAIRRKAL